MQMTKLEKEIEDIYQIIKINTINRELNNLQLDATKKEKKKGKN